MNTIEVKSTIPVKKAYDVVVAGAGVAGVAAAIQALQRRTPSIMVGETRENSKLYFEMTKKK